MSMKFIVRTICFDATTVGLDCFTQIGPFGKVLEIESNVVGLSQVIEVARVKVQEIRWCHRSDQMYQPT